MDKLKQILIGLLLVLGVAINCFGQENISIYSLAANKTTVFAGTLHGIYISTDYGENWKEINSGIPVVNGLSIINSIGISESDVYIALGLDGVYKSSNNGASWNPANNGLPVGVFVSIILVQGNKIFACTQSHGIYVSSDNGNNWKDVNEGLKDNKITSLAGNGTTIFAGGHVTGVHCSTDEGESWTHAHHGLHVHQITHITYNGNNAYVGGRNTGIYRTNDNGAEWDKVSNGFNHESGLTSLASNKSTVFAGTQANGIYVSRDNGNNWIESNEGLSVLSIHDVVAVGDTIYAGTSDGMFVSLNNGKNWKEIDNGFPGKHESAVASSQTSIIDNNLYVEIGTKSNVTLYAKNSQNTVMFGLKNHSDVAVIVTINVECNEKDKTNERKPPVLHQIPVAANSNISFETDPAVCGVDICKGEKSSFNILDWSVN